MDQNDQIEAKTALNKTIIDFSVFVSNVFAPVMTNLISAMTTVYGIYLANMIMVLEKTHELFWNTYIQNGAIYGENQEGFERWLKELIEIQHLENEAEQIKFRHSMIADFKKSLAEKNVTSRN